MIFRRIAFLRRRRRASLLPLLLYACTLFTSARCLEYDSYDDNQEFWSSLNRTVEGRLLRGEPFAKACFSLTGSLNEEPFDSSACISIQSGYRNESEYLFVPQKDSTLLLNVLQH